MLKTKKKQRRGPAGGLVKPWDVTRDPSGTFTGPFSWDDICYTAARQNWPEGISFRNVYSGDTIVYRGGRLYKNGKPTRIPQRFLRGVKRPALEATP